MIVNLSLVFVYLSLIGECCVCLTLPCQPRHAQRADRDLPVPYRARERERENPGISRVTCTSNQKEVRLRGKISFNMAMLGVSAFFSQIALATGVLTSSLGVGDRDNSRVVVGGCHRGCR